MKNERVFRTLIRPEESDFYGFVPAIHKYYGGCEARGQSMQEVGHLLTNAVNLRRMEIQRDYDLDPVDNLLEMVVSVGRAPYRAYLQEEPEGGYSGFIPALPTITQGETFDQMRERLVEVGELVVEHLQAEGRAVPPDDYLEILLTV